MADRTVADIIADECIHDDADLATLRAMVHEVERLREAVGGLTANVKRWRNRASAERLKRQRWRKRALAAEAEVERLRELLYQALTEGGIRADDYGVYLNHDYMRAYDL